MSVGFFYPEWLRAKRQLVEAIENRGSKSVASIVTDFFNHHIFEVGIDVTTDYESYFQIPKERIEELNEEKAAYSLINNIFKNKLYVKQNVESFMPVTVTRYKILVVGCPKILGKGTRESQLEE